MGEVTRLSIQSRILMGSRLHVRWGKPPRVTSPTWGPPPSRKQALTGNLFGLGAQRGFTRPSKSGRANTMRINN